MMITRTVFEQYGDHRDRVHGRIIFTNRNFLKNPKPNRVWTKELWIEWMDDDPYHLQPKDWDKILLESMQLALYNVEKDKVRKSTAPETWVLA